MPKQIKKGKITKKNSVVLIKYDGYKVHNSTIFKEIIFIDVYIGYGNDPSTLVC